jgi:hypothetical protein
MGFSLRHVTSVSLVLCGLVTACAGSEDATTFSPDAGAGDDGAIATPHDSGPSADGGSSGTDAGGATMCMSGCRDDSDCQSSCPPAQNGGINCCDIGSGVCFGSSTGTCPAGAGDASMD